MELPVDVPDRVVETIELAVIVLLAVMVLRFVGRPATLTANVTRGTSSWVADISTGGLDTFLVLIGVVVTIVIYDSGQE
ncbi:MAG: hypothetical protein SVU32_03400 [Candidatus Nanohaloarchaea archaeon]|nr:hypothetical protein [Candidatus Nanohaloarchaea archaeon]